MMCYKGLRDIYVQRVDASGSLLWRANGVPVCAAAGDQTYPAIISDGVGGAIITWMDERTGGKTDIYAQRVDASGVPQWTADGVPVCTAAGDMNNPVILPDVVGGAIIGWEDGRSGSYSDIYVQRVNAAGAPQWAADGVAVCTAANWQMYPKLASDGAGGTIIDWWDQRAGGYDIYAQRVDASGSVRWAMDGVGICTLAGTQYGNDIASDDAGGAIVTWYDERSGNKDIYAQRVDASGVVRWVIDGIAICAASGSQYHPLPISDGAGGVIISWDDLRSGGYDVYAQRVDTSGSILWAPNGVAICAATGNQSSSRIVSDGAGGAIIAWGDRRSGNSDIYTQRINTSGVVQWTADGLPVCSATGARSISQVIADGAFGAIIIWSDIRDTVNNEIYVQRVDGSGAAQWTADGVAATRTGSQQSTASIASDGAGGAIVAYEDDRSGGNGDVYVQRVDAFGTIEWTEEGVGVATGTPYQFYPLIVSDGAGGGIIAYGEYSSGSYDIYAQKVDASGAIQWAASGVAICTAPGQQSLDRVIPDGAGGAIIVWTDYAVDGNSDIYAQRVSAAGAMLWTAGGAAVCAAAGDQRSAGLVTDLAGGAIIVWEDYRGGTYGDIYIQRLDASGAPQWGTNGAAVCTAANNQYGPRPASDGAGGVIIVWGDGRVTTNKDIYAQRVDASGAALWTANGVALCSSAGTQEGQCIISDGAGGAIVAWEDSRISTFNSDIYAQRVNAAGALQWGTNGAAVCTLADDQWIPQIISDGAGGAVIVWINQPSSGGGGDPYAQRVNSAGIAYWAANGIPVADPVASVGRFGTAADGAAGV
ncbi:MAG: hypothetical protein NTW97_11640, partial [Candidatus Krumholzibacteria bacterium]|nr:hypothetical protein [Candidatus Krumholzibacteria bacterium]